MASKPRSQWSPAYRRRIERAEAAGKTRAQARGHGPKAGVKEHVSRKAREAIRDRDMRSLAEEQFRKGRDAGARSPDELFAAYRAMGERNFRKLEAGIGQLAGRRRAGQSGSDLMAELAADYDMDESELYYG